MQHFYDGQIRRYLTQMIRLMSNFSYEDGDKKLTQIPVMYGDITRQVGSIIRENSENKIPSAPRMGVYVTGLEMDTARLADASFISKVNVRERAYDAQGQEYLNESGKNYTVERLMPKPYTLSVNCDIWSTNTDQKLQILEQILMLFNPSFEIQNPNEIVFFPLKFKVPTKTFFCFRTFSGLVSASDQLVLPAFRCFLYGSGCL